MRMGGETYRKMGGCLVAMSVTSVCLPITHTSDKLRPMDVFDPLLLYLMGMMDGCLESSSLCIRSAHA